MVAGKFAFDSAVNSLGGDFLGDNLMAPNPYGPTEAAGAVDTTVVAEVTPEQIADLKEDLPRFLTERMGVPLPSLTPEILKDILTTKGLAFYDGTSWQHLRVGTMGNDVIVGGLEKGPGEGGKPWLDQDGWHLHEKPAAAVIVDPIAPESSNTTTQQAPVAAETAEAAKPAKVEQQVAEKPKVEPRELEGVAEARELNLKELARHANYQGTVVKDGVTYDVWKSKNHDLTHLLPHRG